MRILYVGDDRFEMYVKAFYNATLSIKGVEARIFSTNILDKSRFYGSGFARKFQNRYAIGPIVITINKGVIKEVIKYKPDLVFFYSTRHITSRTAKKINKLGSTIYIYNNDNPFAGYYQPFFWRNYKKLAKHADIGYVYRMENINDLKKIGCRDVRLLRSYYIKERNFFVDRPLKDNVVPSVVFMGHYEKDDRGEYIEALVEERINVGIPNSVWNFSLKENEHLTFLDNYMECYNDYLNSAKIALVFLSTINHDTYTRRIFEIPATKTLMISVYTEDIASLFEEDKEIVFFRTKEELVSKIKYYLSHEEEANIIANAAYERLLKDGHEVTDRVNQILKDYESMEKNK